MHKFIVKTAAIGVLVFLFVACSKKTVTENTSQDRPQTNQERQPRGERPQFSDLLAQMDTNKDGKLSQSEAQGPLKNNFAQMDSNKDGFITESEFTNAPPPPRRGRN